MSLTPKEMVFGAAATTAFLGLVVYNQHKFNKLQAEIDELKQETKTMARYIQILESKVAGDFHTILNSHDGHHHHHAHAALPQEPEIPKPAKVEKPALEEAKPEVPLIPESRRPISQPRHVRQPVKQTVPVKAAQNPIPARVTPPVKTAPPVVKRAIPAARPAARKPIVVEEPEDSGSDPEDNKNEEEDTGSGEASGEESNEETPQNSNRRAPPVKPQSGNTGVRSINQSRNPVPRAAAVVKTASAASQSSNKTPTAVPAKPQHVITVEEGKPPKDKEEEESYNPAEDNNKRAVEISGGRPTPPKAGGPRTTGPKSGGDKKRFGPKVDDSEDSDMRVSSNKVKGKSILKNPSSGSLTNGASNGSNGMINGKHDDEPSIDADLADDMAMVASKSSKRAEDNEGREVGQTEARARMAKTAQIAEAMRKKAEEREKKAVASN